MTASAPHYDNLSDLLAAIDSLDLGSPEGWAVAATISLPEYDCKVNSDSTTERVREFALAAIAGADLHERTTPGGMVGLSDRPGKPEGLYIYVLDAPVGHSAPPVAAASCCGLAQPAGAECAYCGQEVAK